MGSLFDPPNYLSPASWVSQIAPPLISAPSQVPVLVPAQAAPLFAPLSMWVAVTDRFKGFHNNLLLTQAQCDDAETKRAGVVSCLNSYYYNHSSNALNSFLVGSWGKDTMMRPPRDVDLYFLLPASVYYRFTGGRQSALLQEVRGVISPKYWNTTVKGDTHIVLVDFGSYKVEVVPAFQTTTPWIYLICDSSGGGSYKDTAPGNEIQHVQNVDQTCAWNLRPLIRMAKTWQLVCHVPIKSFHIELIAAEFLQASPWREKNWFYFDWILRDFFLYLCNRANGSIAVPGTGEIMNLGDAWYSRAYSAWIRSLKACEYEKLNYVEAAGAEWQKIFGSYIPMKP